MNQRIISIALFGAISLPMTVYAEIDTLDEVVVTASRMPQSLNKTLADTSVLNEQDIKKSGATDVSTLLRSLPGVEVAQTGGMGSTSSVFMRGTNSNQVLVLLDGVRINSATTGSTAIEHLMLDSIERIEVVRGNVSSLYGSEAIGGVIQLFTKQGRGSPAFNASAGVGSHGTQRVSAGFSGEVNDTSFSVNAGKIKTDGVSAINPLLVPTVNPNKNGYDNNAFSAQVKHMTSADHLLTASLFNTRGNISFDAGGPTALNNTIVNINKVSLVSDDQLNEVWHSQLRLAQGDDDRHTSGVYPSVIKTRSNQFAWQNNIQITTKHRLNLSVEHLGQLVISDKQTPYVQSIRQVDSLLAGYAGDYGSQQMQLNLRQDRYSDFGVISTGLLGYGLVFKDNWRIATSISNAFKAPTFDDMYLPFVNYGFGFSYGGNPNLKPERSQNKEIGLYYASNEHHFSVLGFDNTIQNFIVGNGLPAYTMINIPQARILGQELNYAGDFGNKHIKVGMTFQNPRDGTTGAVLPRRAKQFGNVAASHDFGDWSMGAEMRFSGARMDGVQTLRGYELFNLTTRYQIAKDLSLSGRVDNLFNRNYSEAYSYNTLGRTLFIGLTYQQ